MRVSPIDPTPAPDPPPFRPGTRLAELQSQGAPGRFQQLQWQTDGQNGNGVTRASAVADASAPRTPRWLVIHTDAGRRVRVDLYAWQKTYSLDEARQLVRSVAASVTTLPALHRYFEGIVVVDKRVQALRRAMLDAAAGQLKRLGIAALEPGEVAIGSGCAASLSGSGRALCVGRYIGSVPVAAAASDARGRPTFTFVHRAPEFQGQGVVDGRPDLQLRMFYWDVPANMWKVAGLQGVLFEPVAFGRDTGSPAIIEALEARGQQARAEVHVWHFASYDLEARPQEVDVAKFLARAQRYRRALATGRIIANVKAADRYS
jgi:hypothetical protein